MTSQPKDRAANASTACDWAALRRSAGRVLLFLVILYIAPFAGAKNTIRTRSHSLNGTWSFRFDEHDIGEKQQWYATDVSGEWASIKVPGSYNVQFPSERSFTGKAWYRRNVALQLDAGEHAFVHLDGSVLRSRLWVNGKEAGQSMLPYTPLEFEVTSLLCTWTCTNVMVLEIDNKVQSNSVPDTNWNGWQNTGGLIWPVSLIVKPAVYASMHLDTGRVEDGWLFHAMLSLHSENPPQDGAMKIRIMDGDRVLWSDKHHVSLAELETQIPIGAKLQHIHPWSPDSPHLYRFIAEMDSEGSTTELANLQFGFREIKVLGSTILLNGKPITLRGINRHSFYPGVGMSVPPEKTLRDFRAMKALHANFVRLAHYSQPEEVYEACDRLGLLVWSEVPIWQASLRTLSNMATWNNSIEPLLRTNIMAHWNHPSVVVWSVANEIPSDKPQGAAFIAKAVRFVKELDASRLVTFASDKREHDLGFGPVDLIAINEYYGWYYGQESDLGAVLDLLHRKYPDKPLFVSEYGAESIAGWRRTDVASKDYSLEHQVAFLQKHLDQIYAPERGGFVAGGAPWLFSDFPLPYPSQGREESSPPINAKGLVDQYRVRKPAWRTVEQRYKVLEKQAERATP